MNTVNSIFLSNLPFGISEDELKTDLLKIFPQVFTAPSLTNTLKVTVYLPDGQSTVGVVSGFEGDLKDMMLVAKANKIQGRMIVMKKDKGDERDMYGKFKTTLPAASRRRLDQMSGVSHRKVLQVFKKSFLNEVNVKLIDGATKNTLYLNTVTFDLNMLKSPGELQFWKSNAFKKSTRIRYSSSLETLQAIRYLNNNENLSHPAPLLTDIMSQEKSRCFGGKGLGFLGNLLNIKEEEIKGNGVVLFTKFDSDILDVQAINGGFESKCWRCKNPFTLTGVDLGLNFVSGVCKCQYASELNLTSEFRGYHWPMETFTRLSLGQKTTNRLIISHCPMKMSYTSRQEYKDIVLPIIEEEWNYSSREFKKAHYCDGVVERLELVETVFKKGKLNNLYCIQVSVRKTKFWTAENIVAIKNVTLQIQIIRQNTKKVLTELHKGKVRKIINEKEDFVLLFIRTDLQWGTTPQLKAYVSITPKADKSEYTTTRHVIQKWVKEEKNLIPLTKVFLDSNHPRNWKLGANEFALNGILMRNHLSVITMHHDLNIEQNTALDRAMEHSMSFIHGPPGTGKTFVAATIAITLRIYEGGPILVCAPSNVAADGIAEMITSLGNKYNLPTKVLRVLSKTRERKFMNKWNPFVIKDEENYEQPSGAYTYLHDEVQKLIPKTKKSFQKVLKKICQGKEYLLTQAEKITLDTVIAGIELEVMQKFDVFVCTVGVLADKRIEACSKRRPIHSVIADEIGEMTQPSTLILLSINPRRIVFAGDHLQFPPTLFSYSAEVAGLERSLMEWVSLNNDTNNKVPWTTLLEQHRMEEKIRELVSAVSYQNKLRDAPLIHKRKTDLPHEIYCAIPLLRISPILVFDHASKELTVGNSYVNEGQANKVIDLVEDLLRVGVSASKISILTLYEAQRDLVRGQLNSLGGIAKDVFVCNVDGFQGRENSIIIVSFVRSNEKGILGFTSIQNRLNVAISRDKFFLLIICNFEALKAYKSQVITTFTKKLMETAAFVKC